MKKNWNDLSDGQKKPYLDEARFCLNSGDEIEWNIALAIYKGVGVHDNTYEQPDYETIFENTLNDLVKVMNNPLYSHKMDFMNKNNITKEQLENSPVLQCDMLSYVISKVKEDIYSH